MTNSLFDFDDTPEIDGLIYISDFITVEEEKCLLRYIDNHVWLNDLKRRVQHFGYRYDYKARKVTQDSYLGDLPEWLKTISQKFYDEKIFLKNPDQVIVNEYLPGQGISAHIDCVPCFDDKIASVTLASGAFMQFQNDHIKEKIYLEPRSVIILSGSARYDWTHGIRARKSDVVNGEKIYRNRRVSLTFRNIILDQ